MKTKKMLEKDELERCNNVPMLEVPACQTWQMMMASAFRYALRRHTCIVPTTAVYLAEVIEAFDKKWLLLFRRELKEYLDWYYADPEASGEFKCDVETWETFYNTVVERLEELGGVDDL